ncbi:TorD/DmsD family molecular chaperone [Salinarimonas soli]|nr:molecular chaperone TorD family protein [Salinarimonas soli]
MTDEAAHGADALDEIDRQRAHEYTLLAVVLGRAPTRDVLDVLSGLQGDASPLGMAHIALAEAASQADPAALQREYFDLFVGVGRGELLPYGSYYQAGFLHDRPLARVRDDLVRLGIERVERLPEPEDHVAILCETMAGLVDGRFGTPPGEDRVFFERHLKPWAGRFFADLAVSPSARFYRSVAELGGLFVEVEAQAFAMDG